jgi:hypothetical protein
MRFAPCNEGMRHLPVHEQSNLSAVHGYDGLEVACFMPNPDAPLHLNPAQRSEHRRMAEDTGQPINGLHWFLITSPGRSIPGTALHGKTCDVVVEPFDYCPDPIACAACAIGYLRDVDEGIKA